MFFIFYGFGEYSGCYDELGKFLLKLGILVFFYDYSKMLCLKLFFELKFIYSVLFYF